MGSNNNNDNPVNPNTWQSSVKSFMSGGVGGVFLVLAGHPLDLVKVKVQTSGGSMLSTLKNIMRSDGLIGVYRGVLPPLVGIAPIMATSFWGYHVGKQIARGFYGMDDSEPLSLKQTVFAGGFSALPATLLVAPGERIKCLMQVSAAQGKSKKGMLEIATSIYQQGGVRSLYRGTFITLIRDVPGSMAYFAVYETLKRMLSPGEGRPPSIPAIVAAGGIAGMVNWMIAIPADVLKSRIQTAPDTEYRGLVATYKNLIKNEGYLGLYRGLTPALLRAFPANAACFLGVELSLKVMNKIF